MTLVTDPAITEYLNRLEQAIVRNSDLHGCFTVKLINDVEANAFSLPGGFLYLKTGLILSTDNEAELVVALGHETGHVTAHHFTKIDTQRRIWGRLALAAGPVGYLVRRHIGPLITFKLLRDAEFEADRLALQYQSASGYDPIESIRLLENTFPKERKPSSFFARLFDPYPSTDRRIERLSQVTWRQYPIRMNYVVDTDDFHEMKLRVAAVMGIATPDSLPRHESAAAR